MKLGDQIQVVWPDTGEIRRGTVDGWAGGRVYQYTVAHPRTPEEEAQGEVIDTKDEGVLWIHGWDAEAAGALRAAYNLADEEPTRVDTTKLGLTKTGRWQGRFPNIANRPRPAR